jgi:hypothetical protein
MRRPYDAEANQPGQHLMRTRIRTPVYEQLILLAEEESERINAHVTVSDLVRVACVNHLLIHGAMRQLENLPPEEFAEDLDEWEWVEIDEGAEDEDEDEDDDLIVFHSNPDLDWTQRRAAN